MRLYIVLVLLLVSACHAKPDPNVAYYTCPMHPEIHQEAPGKCPICGMDLTPVMKGDAQSGVMIAPERAALLGVKAVPAARKTMSRTVRASASIASDPELAVAQEEYLGTLRLMGKSDRNSFVQSAKKKLLLLGMSEDWIRELTRTRRVDTELYLPRPGGRVLIDAFAHEQDLPNIAVGQLVDLIFTSNGGKTYGGQVIGVAPVISPVTRTARVRIETRSITDNQVPIKAGTYLTAKFQIPLGDQMVVPRSAVMNTGERQWVIVTKDNRYEPRPVILGEENQDDVVIREGITEGEQVVSSANFLVDSEAQIKNRLESPSEHQH